jgi:hypothetical protein
MNSFHTSRAICLHSSECSQCSRYNNNTPAPGRDWLALPSNAKSNFRVIEPDGNPSLNLETVTMCLKWWERILYLVQGRVRLRQEMLSEKLLRAYVVFMVCLRYVFAY